MRVAISTLSAPPTRHIGSELMTFRLAAALVAAGHDVTVHPTDGTHGTFQGVTIDAAPLPPADVYVCHADYGIRARRARKLNGSPVVAICHNTSSAVKVGLVNTRPALTVANSHSMADALGVADPLIVNPPAPDVVHTRLGRCVTIASLNELKGGHQFWQLADMLNRTPFLALQGGYGDQIIEQRPNVRVLDHVPPAEMDARVWRHTGIFLQLSESESWGMAAAEAIAHGIPVIAHPTPGIIDNLGRAAVYVDRDDIGGIASAILSIFARPEPMRGAALERAQQHAAASEQQVADWVTAIERLAVSDASSAR